MSEEDGINSGMFIVRKPQLVAENDMIYEKAKEASSKLPCPAHSGGHSPKAIKPEERPDSTTFNMTAWGWSHSMWAHNGHVDFAYFCEHCHGYYFIELPREKDGE